MRAGKLRHRVTITEPIETQDDYGEPVKNWKPIADGQVWAEKRDLSGRELFQAQQINAEISTEFRIRHRDDIDARMSIEYRDAYWHIESVQDPDGMRKKLLLLCAKSVDG